MALRDFDVGALGDRARVWLAGEVTDVAAPRTAATVMLVRDGASGVDVFMLRRVASMAFAPSMWVFPGGGVDPRDDAADLPWAGPSAAEWATRLGCDEGLARSLVSAAVREVFEECGVLLAGPSADTVVADLRDPEWDAERAALLSREQSLSEMLLRRGLVLRSDLLAVKAHWVTPEFEPRRYDTWFFAALLPEGQIPDDDTSEADVSDWVVPADLLDAYAAGSAGLLPPTVVCVESVGVAPSATGFLASGGSVEAVMPELLDRDGQAVMRIRLP
ncbi:MAG: NUDIX hydrolase [Lapillicoccus sp.]